MDERGNANAEPSPASTSANEEPSSAVDAASSAVRSRRTALVIALVLASLVVWVVAASRSAPFPPDTMPEGAYLRIAKSIGDERPREVFAYLETDAQWACYTIGKERKDALAEVRAHYPETQRADLEARYRPEAEAPDGADVFVIESQKHGYVGRLRRDLSGIARIEVDGERASVVTARGTRYPFRRRDNGIWGLTLFTAELLAEADRDARDLATVKSAAEDYARAGR